LSIRIITIYKNFFEVCGVWFDANEGIVYALAVIGEGCSLEAYAEDLFHPGKAN